MSEIAALPGILYWKRAPNEVNGMMDEFVILIVVMGSWNIHVPKLNPIIYFEYVQFIICQVYLNKASFNFFFFCPSNELILVWGFHFPGPRVSPHETGVSVQREGSFVRR